MTANQNTPPQPRFKRRFWFALHGWFAVPIWGALFLICATGTLATVSQEITWLFKPEVRSPISIEAPRLDLIETAIKQTYPNSTIDDIHIDAPYLAYRVRINTPEGERRSLLFNPQTGKFQGESSGAGFRGFILALHGWLLFPWQENYSLGWYLVTLFSIPLLGSVITGLVIIKRFWHQFFRPQIRRNKGKRVFWGDLHRLLGVWSIWFITLIGVTGSWFLIQGVISHNQIALYPEPPKIICAKATGDCNVDQIKTVSLQHYTDNARSVFPDLRITYIDLPNQSGDPVIVRGNRDWSLYQDNVNAVYLNPTTAEPTSTHSPSNISALNRVVAIMTPVHFGDFAGLTSKLVWFVFGCGLCTLIASGFWVWMKRTAHGVHRANTSVNRRKGKQTSLIPPQWHGFKLVSWGVALLPITFLVLMLV